MNGLQPTCTSSLTASGERAAPWGVLKHLPITVGKLTLPLNVCVTSATNYDLLIGNDWLSQASANLDWESATLHFLVGPSTVDTVPLDLTGKLRGTIGHADRPAQLETCSEIHPTLGITFSNEEDLHVLDFQASPSDSPVDVPSTGEETPAVASLAKPNLSADLATSTGDNSEPQSNFVQGEQRSCPDASTNCTPPAKPAPSPLAPGEQQLSTTNTNTGDSLPLTNSVARAQKQSKKQPSDKQQQKFPHTCVPG